MSPSAFAIIAITVACTPAPPSPSVTPTPVATRTDATTPAEPPTPEPAKPEPPTPEAATPELRDERFVATIRTAAGAYAKWGRVDERPNIAPGLCRMPTRSDYGEASHARLSLAPDGPHGTKLYYLWASQRGAYLALNAKTKPAIPNGFTIVKQSFVATSTPPAKSRAARSVIGVGLTSAPVGWIETDRGRMFTGEPAGLYVMTKVGKADGTDDGWVYGTVSATGEVTSAGRVESCMGCHEAAAHDRLFGLQPTKKLVDLAPPGARDFR